MIFVSHKNGIECILEIERINGVILEDAEEYEGLTNALWNQVHKIDETLLLYNEKNELLDMSKRCDIIFSFKDLSLQNSRIQKKLMTYLTEDIQKSELEEEIVENQAELLRIMEEVKELSDYPICVNDDYNIADLLKYAGIKLAETEGSFCEKLIDYMKISYDFLKIDVFFLIGCKGYIKDKDYQYLQEWTSYQQITLVFIEYDESRLPLGMNKYIIDSDKCVIH